MGKILLVKPESVGDCSEGETFPLDLIIWARKFPESDSSKCIPNVKYNSKNRICKDKYERLSFSCTKKWLNGGACHQLFGHFLASGYLTGVSFTIKYQWRDIYWAWPFCTGSFIYGFTHVFLGSKFVQNCLGNYWILRKGTRGGVFDKVQTQNELYTNLWIKLQS